MKEFAAALMCTFALMNMSAPMSLPVAKAEAPRSDFVCIGVTSAVPTREAIEAKREAEKAEAEAKKAETETNARIEARAEVKTMTVLATGYCPCSYCCGKSDGITSTGVRATEGRTIAVDPRMIPYGTHVLITDSSGNSHEYVAEDCGGDIQNSRIDIYFESHADANAFGRQWGELEVIN